MRQICRCHGTDELRRHKSHRAGRHPGNSSGTNLLAGLDNLLDDLERSQGEWDISTTDHDAFEVGKNLATTPGKVVFQNELLQLIQYLPATTANVVHGARYS